MSAHAIQVALSISGIVIVIIGLSVSTFGAVLIYRADFPRNDWIVEAATTAASKPSYAVIAPNGYSPEIEIGQGYLRGIQLREQTQQYALVSKRGMRFIFAGFIVQVIGNVFFIIGYVVPLFTAH